MWLRRQMSASMGLEEAYVDRLANSADHHYRIRKIRKRSGGHRNIWSLSRELKAVQRWIARRVLSPLPVHTAAVAYEPGASIKQNALVHVKSDFLLRMDFRRFFESIRREDVLDFLSHTTGLPIEWERSDSDLLARLCTWRKMVVIGAVTSPLLTNRMCLRLDKTISELCGERDTRYTRYADDLFFSTTKPNVLCEVERAVCRIVADLTCPALLMVNKKKTRHSSKKWRRSVTGVVLTPQGKISLGRDRKRRVRALVHQYDHLTNTQRVSLRGMLAFCRDVEPEFVNRLILKYGATHVDQILKLQ